MEKVGFMMLVGPRPNVFMTGDLILRFRACLILCCRKGRFRFWAAPPTISALLCRLRTANVAPSATWPMTFLPNFRNGRIRNIHKKERMMGLDMLHLGSSPPASSFRLALRVKPKTGEPTLGLYFLVRFLLRSRLMEECKTMSRDCTTHLP